MPHFIKLTTYPDFSTSLYTIFRYQFHFLANKIYVYIKWSSTSRFAYFSSGPSRVKRREEQKKTQLCRFEAMSWGVPKVHGVHWSTMQSRPKSHHQNNKISSIGLFVNHSNINKCKKRQTKMVNYFSDFFFFDWWLARVQNSYSFVLFCCKWLH